MDFVMKADKFSKDKKARKDSIIVKIHEKQEEKRALISRLDDSNKRLSIEYSDEALQDAQEAEKKIEEVDKVIEILESNLANVDSEKFDYDIDKLRSEFSGLVNSAKQKEAIAKAYAAKALYIDSINELHSSTKNLAKLISGAKGIILSCMDIDKLEADERLSINRDWKGNIMSLCFYENIDIVRVQGALELSYDETQEIYYDLAEIDRIVGSVNN